MKPIPLTLSIVGVSLALFAQTACLKTRAQIKGTDSQQDSADGGEDAKGYSPKSTHYEMEEIRTELTRLSGKLEEVDHMQRGQNFQEVKEYASRLDGRIAELEKNQVLLMTELKALKDKQAADSVAAKEAAVPTHDLFSAANQLLSENRYEEASEKFRNLVNKGLKGKEAAEAHFGLGEAEYGQKNYKKAIVQYSKVQEAFAKSPRIPASLFRIGMSFQHLNMPKEAKGFFNELVERYPKSGEAKRARAKVKE